MTPSGLQISLAALGKLGHHPAVRRQAEESSLQ